MLLLLLCLPVQNEKLPLLQIARHTWYDETRKSNCTDTVITLSYMRECGKSDFNSGN
jgi:hypothetical protein